MQRCSRQIRQHFRGNLGQNKYNAHQAENNDVARHVGNKRIIKAKGLITKTDRNSMRIMMRLMGKGYAGRVEDMSPIMFVTCCIREDKGKQRERSGYRYISHNITAARKERNQPYHVANPYKEEIPATNKACIFHNDDLS